MASKEIKGGIIKRKLIKELTNFPILMMINTYLKICKIPEFMYRVVKYFQMMLRRN